MGRERGRVGESERERVSERGRVGKSEWGE